MKHPGRQSGQISFKRRIAISNAVMIIVPALAALLCAAICALIGWNVLLSGSIVEDSSDFQQAGISVDATATAALSSSGTSDSAERFNRLDSLLDRLDMGLIIEPANSSADSTESDASESDSSQSDTAASSSSDTAASSSSESPVYEHDARTSADSDPSLLAQAHQLGDSSFIQSGQNAVRVSTIEAGGSQWRLYLQGSVRPQISGSGIVTFAIIAIAALFLVVVISAILANRFVSRFLIRKVQERLGLIQSGLEQLDKGNLHYRIDTIGSDEFAPACREFNRMADALESSITAVKQQDSRRARLVADVSHDLRTPLSSIRGYAEGLRDGVAATPSARARYLDTIIRKSNEMSALLERMLDYSKLELQQSEYKPELTRIDKLVSECADDYRDRLAITLEAAPATVYVDAQLMRRVINNILDNAVKYGTQTPAPVQIHVGQEQSNNQTANKKCTIEIADHGTHVSEKEASSLFDLFYRADTARASTTKGSGIGLAFAKRAIEGMGGTIVARPNGQAGLIVTITLPEKDSK